MYDIEKFYQAADVEDAVRALVEDPEAVVISGGSDVLIKIREGKLAGCSLVSIHGIKELEGIRMEEDGTIVIGPATTFSHITNNSIIQKHIPMLGDAVDMAGGPQLRNIGTIGGNVCNGVTSADSASSLCCLDAVLVLKGPDGVREVPISQWYTGPGRTVRNHDEVLTAIRIKKENYQGYGGHYIKYGKRNAMEIATLGCAVSVKLSEDKKQVTVCLSNGEIKTISFE
jgi:xanthine dehydrogenase FAD-binding subunit